MVPHGRHRPVEASELVNRHYAWQAAGDLWASAKQTELYAGGSGISDTEFECWPEFRPLDQNSGR